MCRDAYAAIIVLRHLNIIFKSGVGVSLYTPPKFNQSYLAF